MINSRTHKAGALCWKVPEGSWSVVRIHLLTMNNKPLVSLLTILFLIIFFSAPLQADAQVQGKANKQNPSYTPKNLE